jgi:uncharacterized protein (DUF58 family)
VRRRAGARLEGYAIVVAAGLLAALAFRRPELAIVVTPAALLLVLALSLARDPRIEVGFRLEAARSVEGQDVEAVITLSAEAPVDRLELWLALPEGIEGPDGVQAWAVRLAAHEVQELRVALHCWRWGVYELGELELRARDRLRVVVWEDSPRIPSELKVYPAPERLSRIVSPLETQAFVGSEVAPVKGDGIEYADIRDFAPGDRMRAINWRASARRGSLVVNERYPERNTDVVLFVDSFVDVRGPGRSTLEDAVRATATLAGLYLARRDRVGLVAFGGMLHWLQPGLGSIQRYRLIETLLETKTAPDYTWRNVDLIPARILPPKALVVGVTPFVDPRFGAALENLRARGFDVVVIEVDPVPLVEPGRTEVERLAYRLWLLEREVLHAHLERLGVGVAKWSEDSPLDAALEGVRTYRRYARPLRV